MIEENILLPNIDIQGELPEKGNINLDKNCDTELSSKSGKYCAIKNFDSDVEVGYYKKGKCEISGSIMDKIGRASCRERVCQYV